MTLTRVEREAARLTSSLYYLLPTLQDALEIPDPKLPKSLFDPTLWQASIIASVLTFMQQQVAAQTEQDAKQALFTKFLQTAQEYCTRIDKFRLTKTNLKPEDWLCVAGVNSETRVRMKITNTTNGPLFDLGSQYRLNMWRKGKQADERLTGDGTVPFKSAQPNFLAPENLVCVTPEDYGYWEVQDRVVANIAGFHAIICNMDMLHQLIVRYFTGKPNIGNNTWGYPPPGVHI